MNRLAGPSDSASSFKHSDDGRPFFLSLSLPFPFSFLWLLASNPVQFSKRTGQRKGMLVYIFDSALLALVGLAWLGLAWLCFVSL